MKKLFILVILFGLPLSSYADDNLVKLCSFLGVTASIIDEQVKKGKSIDSVGDYKNLQEVFSNNGAFIQSEIKSFISTTTPSLSSDYIGSFYSHACVNKYITNELVIERLTPMIKESCAGTTEPPFTCITKTVQKFANSL